MRISDWSSDVCSSDLNLPRSFEEANEFYWAFAAKYLLATRPRLWYRISRRPLFSGYALHCTNVRFMVVAHFQESMMQGIIFHAREKRVQLSRYPALPTIKEKDRKSTSLNSSH